jgi:hypothetical protein
MHCYVWGESCWYGSLRDEHTVRTTFEVLIPWDISQIATFRQLVLLSYSGMGGADLNEPVTQNEKQSFPFLYAKP